MMRVEDRMFLRFLSFLMKWHPWFHALIRRLYYSRITLTGVSHLPSEGPVLALCLHRNGAVDAFVYRGVIGEVVFMVKDTLRKSVMGRLFFDGIEVARSKDSGERAGNIEAVNQCVTWLGGGGWLGIFPEGTSQLGPRHLPFKSGAARIALKHLESGRELTVVALGIHYECPWAFRSRVEVVVGPPLKLSPSDARLPELKERFSGALEDVGVNFPDERWQDLAEKFACIATLGTKHRYFDALKAMERQLPADAVRAWSDFETKAGDRRVPRHQGVPLFPLSTPFVYCALTIILGIPVIAGAVLNLPPVAVAWWAGRRFPDDRNVIALWHILTGVPLLALWAALWCLAGGLTGLWWLPLGYLSLSSLSVFGWYRLKKSAVVAWNGMFHGDLRDDALAVHREVLAFFDTSTQPFHPHDRPAASTVASA
jgi:1-acyl-sn-glycerol-3-phosphate acyltransferase